MTIGVLDRRPSLDPYPNSAGSLNEELLVAAYAGSPTQRTVEPCVCGGLIVVVWPLGIPAAVGTHQRTPRHLAWRATREDG